MRDALFFHRALGDDFAGKCYSDADRKAFLLVTDDGEYGIFAGDWACFDIPVELLPGEFFTSACPPEAFAKLEALFDIKKSWPCWRYYRDEGFGPGPWDELDSLRPDDAKNVDRYWDLRDDAEEYLRDNLEKYVSAAIRDERGKLVAWAGLHWRAAGISEMGFAHTVEEHRGKGYATLITKALVNRITETGDRSMCYTFKTNDASIAVLEKCGFTRDGEATWADVGELK